MKAVIVDDEESGRKVLRFLLEDNCPEVTVVAEAESVKSGLAALKKHNPDLLFLDIKMPHGSGFDLLDSLSGERKFDLIFTTAHDEFALQAFREAAVDYLLKPIDPEDLINAVSRSRSHKKDNNLQQQVQTLLQQLNLNSRPQKMAFQSLKGAILVDPATIIRCEGDGNYCNIFLVSGERYVVSKNIGEVELQLRSNGFMRIHRSNLINLKHVLEYVKEGNGSVIMADNSSVDISRRKKEEFLKWMRNEN